MINKTRPVAGGPTQPELHRVLLSTKHIDGGPAGTPRVVGVLRVAPDKLSLLVRTGG